MSARVRRDARAAALRSAHARARGAPGRCTSSAPAPAIRICSRCGRYSCCSGRRHSLRPAGERGSAGTCTSAMRKRIFVGKACGERGQQEHIHELLVRLAARASASHASRAATRSCLGAAARRSRCWPRTVSLHSGPGNHHRRARRAAAAELPLTHRRLANSVTFLTDMRAIAALPDWRFFANPRHTVVVYMGCTAPGHRREPAGRRGGTRAPGGHHRAPRHCPNSGSCAHPGQHPRRWAAEQAGRAAGAPDRGRRGGVCRRGYGRRHSPASSGRGRR